MGPRIFIRGNLHELPAAHRARPASMGPRIFIRGNCPLQLGTIDRCMLQWGRGSSSAETSSHRSRTRRRAGFNGAADLHPRKLRRAADPCALPWHASMGPRIFIRGNVGAAFLRGVQGRASMGPRIFIRGNPFTGGVQNPLALLQWGRGSSSAETRARTRSPGNSARCFNGAADLHPRKRQARRRIVLMWPGFNGAADLHPRKRA